MGEARSTYLPNAIIYPQPGAQIRADYLVENAIPASDIHQIIGGRDTIGEALATKSHLPGLRITSFILLTSTLHIPRALWLYQTILGPDYKISPHGIDCGGLLLAEEEHDYYINATQHYFEMHPGCFETTENWQEQNQSLYNLFKIIHDKYHPPGKPSEAYCAVHDLK